MSRRSSIDKKKLDYKPQAGDLVFAKVKGYPPWPARVEAEAPEGTKIANGRFPVYFFGTYESAVIALGDLFPYLAYKDTLGKAKKTRTFQVGMQEIEIEFQNTRSESADEAKSVDDVKSQAAEKLKPEQFVDQSTDQIVGQSSEQASEQPTKQPDDKTASQSTEDENSGEAVLFTEMEVDEKPVERTIIKPKSSAPHEEQSLNTDQDDSEHELVIDDKKQTKASKTKSSNRSRTSVKKANTPLNGNSEPKRSRRRSIADSSDFIVESPLPATEPLTPKQPIDATPVERSRSGRMIKRKRLDDFEENDFSFFERKKRTDSTKTAKTAETNEVKSQESETLNRLFNDEEDASNSDSDYEPTKEEPSNEIETKINNENELKSDNNSDSADSQDVDKNQESDLNSMIDIKSEEKLQKLKAKLQQKEIEKEKRKVQKLEQKRLDKLEKWRTVSVTKEVLKNIEQEIIDSLDVKNKNINRCLHVMNKLDLLPITRKSLHTYISIIQTVKKCRKFKDENVKQKSEQLYNKFKSLYYGDDDESQEARNSANKSNENTIELAEDGHIKELMNDLLVKLSSD